MFIDSHLSTLLRLSCVNLNFAKLIFSLFLFTSVYFISVQCMLDFFTGFTFDDSRKLKFLGFGTGCRANSLFVSYSSGNTRDNQLLFCVTFKTRKDVVD